MMVEGQANIRQGKHGSNELGAGKSGPQTTPNIQREAKTRRPLVCQAMLLLQLQARCAQSERPLLLVLRVLRLSLLRLSLEPLLLLPLLPEEREVLLRLLLRSEELEGERERRPRLSSRRAGLAPRRPRGGEALRRRGGERLRRRGGLRERRRAGDGLRRRGGERLRRRTGLRSLRRGGERRRAGEGLRRRGGLRSMRRAGERRRGGEGLRRRGGLRSPRRAGGLGRRSRSAGPSCRPRSCCWRCGEGGRCCTGAASSHGGDTARRLRGGLLLLLRLRLLSLPDELLLPLLPDERDALLLLLLLLRLRLRPRAGCSRCAALPSGAR